MAGFGSDQPPEPGQRQSFHLPRRMANEPLIEWWTRWGRSGSERAASRSAGSSDNESTAAAAGSPSCLPMHVGGGGEEVDGGGGEVAGGGRLDRGGPADDEGHAVAALEDVGLVTAPGADRDGGPCLTRSGMSAIGEQPLSEVKTSRVLSARPLVVQFGEHFADDPVGFHHEVAVVAEAGFSLPLAPLGRSGCGGW